MMNALRTLTAVTEEAASLCGVRKADLDLGDQVVVQTRNSLYSILSLGDGRYRVSGGWFARGGESPVTITINGCTWGGSAIKTDLVAGLGLHLEFGNTVRTSRIREVRVFRCAGSDSIH
jgi:hypothetical protein